MIFGRLAMNAQGRFCGVFLLLSADSEYPRSAVGLESIEHTVQLTHKWINDFDARLGWGDKHRSFRLLRTVLQALGDWLSVNGAAGFGSRRRSSRGNLLRALAARRDAGDAAPQGLFHLASG
jgi:hypothetical protein